ncbi:IS110 family transposase [Bacteroides sp. 51]|uniref:IS110 family transposase n=1 Tax=Bacteroides sp. 51 TaxID=2302938 RepID=UPI0013D6CF17|nr:IS110 family transposase [Bacteroides sp. 51]NDV83078.1 IS110 family transposase [Bacteroides sp. 51]
MLLQRNSLNFDGENIYVGIDVHKKSWSISIMTDTLVLKGYNGPADPVQLVSHLRDHYPGGSYHSVYEAGFCGLWIHNRLTELGVKNIVVNPSDVPCNGKERERKTDAVDASKLARSLRAGELSGIYIHQQETLHDRSLMRLRSSWVTDMTRLKNRIKGMLHYYGIVIPAELERSSNWSRAFMTWLKNTVLPSGEISKPAFELLLEEYERKRGQQLVILRKIRELSRTAAYHEDMKYLRSVCGIGLLSGMHLLVNIENIHRFENRDKFASFMGFVPTSHSTGEKQINGRITKRAPKELRGILTECAWIAMRNDPALALKYGQLRKRMDENKAIIRIARKLCNRIYYVLKNKTEYVSGVVQ